MKPMSKQDLDEAYDAPVLMRTCHLVPLNGVILDEGSLLHIIGRRRGEFHFMYVDTDGDEFFEDELVPVSPLEQLALEAE